MIFDSKPLKALAGYSTSQGEIKTRVEKIMKTGRFGLAGAIGSGRVSQPIPTRIGLCGFAGRAGNPSPKGRHWCRGLAP